MKKFFLRSVFTLFLVCLITIPTHPARAGVWGESIAASLMKQVMETINRQIEGAILGTLKVAAISMLNSQVGQMIAGSSLGDTLFITDWNDFLYQQPAARAQVYMNDFFTMSTRGKYASANYVSRDDRSGVSGNYMAYLVEGAKQSIGMSEGGSQRGYSLDQYTPNPDVMFQNGDWRSFNAFISNPMNNPFGYSLSAEAYYASVMAQEMEKAKVEGGAAGGFLGVKQGNRTITPAATIERMVSDVQNIGNNLIAAAENPGEFLSGVIGSVVNKAITNLIQKGIGQVQANIQREIGKIDRQVVGALNDANRALGPAAQFTREFSQRTDVYIKPYTAPPSGVVCASGAC